MAEKRPSTPGSDPAPAEGQALVVPDLDVGGRSAPSSNRKPIPKPARVPRPLRPDSEPPVGSGNGLDDDTAGPSARIELEAGPLVSPNWAPARASRALGYDRLDLEPLPRRRSWGKRFLLFAVLLVGASAAAVYAAPFYVKRRVADASNRSGLAVAVGDVEFRPRELVLTHSKIALQGLAGLTLSAGEVEIALDGIEPRAVSVRGFDISVDGALHETYSRLEKWATSLPAPLRLVARSGHIHWSNPWGTGTELEASDVTISTVSTLSLASPSILVGVPNGKLGPWKLKVERTPAETRIGVGLDPADPAAALTITEGQDGPPSVILDVPLSPLSRVGIPMDPVGLAADPYVEAHVRLESVAPPKVLGKIHLALSNLRPAAWHGAGPSDAQLVCGLSGEGPGLASGPISLTDGLVSLGPTKGTVSGTLSLDASSSRLALAFQWPASARKGLPSSFVLDTRDVWGTGRP